MRRRAKYLIVFYLAGWVLSILQSENISYLNFVPINLIGIAFSLMLGNTIYYTVEEKLDPFMATFRALKYVVFSITLIIAAFYLEGFLYKRGIDISPFIGY